MSEVGIKREAVSTYLSSKSDLISEIISTSVKKSDIKQIKYKKTNKKENKKKSNKTEKNKKITKVRKQPNKKTNKKRKNPNKKIQKKKNHKKMKKGRKEETFQQAGFSWLSAKQRNKMNKRVNGNGRLRQNISLAHWNMGSKGWDKKKDEVELVTLQFEPDILIISEANMRADSAVDERNIKGYDMILPKTTLARNMVRILMLVKSDVQVEVLDEFMDSEVAAIWVKLAIKGKKPLVVSGIYREHQYLEQGADNTSESDRSQLERWRRYVNTWSRAARRYEIVVLGDTNLDWLRWDQPEQSKVKMVDLVKTEIETMNFYQLVKEYTRCWPGQPPSLLDQCWTNVPQKLIFQRNLERASSDHNLVITSFRTKDRCEDRHDIVKRVRKDLDVNKYKSDIGGIDWTSLLQSEDIDEINAIFVEKVSEVLDKVVPIKKLQKRKNQKNWVTTELKEEMELRDQLRQRAVVTGDQDDWKKFRKARNNCSKNVTKVKNEHFRKLYEKIETEGDMKKLYSLTGELLDIRTGNLPQRFLVDGRLVSKPSEMADIQLDYYNNKLKKLQDSLPQTKGDPLRILKESMENWEEKDGQ